MMDSLQKSHSKDILVDIEHQSLITEEKMLRNLRYHINTKNKYKKEVQLHVFHTGLRIAPKKYVYDNRIFYLPYLKQTYEIDGIETFNRIKNRIKKIMGA